MSLKDRWHSTVQLALGHAPSVATADLWSQIERRYSETHRHYHTLDHLEACFKLYDGVMWGKYRNASVEFALWFHDIVYDPHQFDNEGQSALLFVRSIPTTWKNMNGIMIDAMKMIMMSNHKTPPTNYAEKLFIDIDLSILGEKAPVFDAYEENVRKEYAFVPDDVYRHARRKIMADFLERATVRTLFHTPEIQDTYEERAIDNLTRSIRKLT